jgi:peptidoglycan/xylan/chitin deacetylase (PgdA/CDA1 family)
MRRRLARLFDRSGVISAINAVRARGPAPWLTAITYHSTVPAIGAETLYDAGAPDVTPEALDRHLRYLKSQFHVVSTADVLGALEGRPLPPRALLLTFDDGYRDNHDVVLPILQQHGVRAVFYVATSFVEERRLFWWDRINYTIKSCKLPLIELEYPEKERWHLASTSAKSASIRRALRIVKTHHGLDLQRFLDHLASAAGVDLDRDTERGLAEDRIMTWDHVRALRAAGMDVQSHTHTHRVLHTLTPEALARELGESRRILEEVLGEPVLSVSYPVGLPLEDGPVREAVRDAGYLLGFTNGTGVNVFPGGDPYNMRRLSVDLEDDDAYFRAMVSVPYFASAHH